MIQGMLEKSGTLWQCKDFEELTVPELYELLALRADEKAWGPEGEALAWLLIVSRPPVGKREMERLWRAFEAYFRCGRVDHQLIQALRLRLAQAHEEGEG